MGLEILLCKQVKEGVSGSRFKSVLLEQAFYKTSTDVIICAR